MVNTKHRVKIYNLSSHKCTTPQISVLSLGDKFAPVSPTNLDQAKIDVLNFSRLILLKAKFSDYSFPSDKRESLISPTSNFIPKSVKSQTLKSIVNDLEILANEIHELPKMEA